MWILGPESRFHAEAEYHLIRFDLMVSPIPTKRSLKISQMSSQIKIVISHQCLDQSGCPNAHWKATDEGNSIVQVLDDESKFYAKVKLPNQNMSDTGHEVFYPPRNSSIKKYLQESRKI